MGKLLRQAAACITLFWANPPAFVGAVLRPDSFRGRELRRLLREAGQ